MKRGIRTKRRGKVSLHLMLRGARKILLLAGITAVGYAVFVVGYADYFQARASRQLERTRSSKHAVSGATRISDYFVEGAPIGELLIPNRGVKAVFVEGAANRDLRKALGHIPGTALPGEPGNVAIAGHRDTFFRPLRLVRPGDIVVLKTRHGLYRYRVQSTRVVNPDDTKVLLPTSYPSLTLVTCYPFYYLGHAPHRFVVLAREILPEKNAV